MTRAEFAKAIAYITAGCGKALQEPSLEVYFDLLGDLDYDTTILAARRVLSQHRYPTFPTIAELREAAISTVRGDVMELSPVEAWAAAWRIVGNTDPEVDGSFGRASKGEHPLVIQAIREFGLMALCYGDEPVAVIRGQFMKAFESIAARAKRTALLPPKVLRELEHRQAAQAAQTLSLAGWEPVKP